MKIASKFITNDQLKFNFWYTHRGNDFFEDWFVIIRNYKLVRITTIEEAQKTNWFLDKNDS